MFKEVIDGVNKLEDMMVEYSEMGSFLFNHNKMFMITSKNAYNTPEYNHQPFTFRYGNYHISDYIKKYVRLNY